MTSERRWFARWKLTAKPFYGIAVHYLAADKIEVCEFVLLPRRHREIKLNLSRGSTPLISQSNHNPLSRVILYVPAISSQELVIMIQTLTSRFAPGPRCLTCRTCPLATPPFPVLQLPMTGLAHLIHVINKHVVNSRPRYVLIFASNAARTEERGIETRGRC